MIYLGTVNWRFPHWIKSFYLKEDPEEWLKHYSNKTSFVEINSTLALFPSEQIVSKWYSDTPEQFIFAANMNKKVTHSLNNEVPLDVIAKFFECLKPLDSKLGVVLIQFPKKLQYSTPNLEFLSTIIQECHSRFDGNLVIDLGNRSWNKDEVNDLIKENTGCVISTDKKPLPTNMKNPDLYYLKLSGDTRLVPKKELGRVYFPRDSDIKQWALHLKFKAKRHRNIFISIDNHFSGDAINDNYKLCQELKKLKLQVSGFKDR